MNNTHNLPNPAESNNELRVWQVLKSPKLMTRECLAGVVTALRTSTGSYLIFSHCRSRS